jgi:serine/threonine-protein kinase
LRQIVEENPVPFARRTASRFASVEPVIMRALSKDPASRFPTTSDFAAAFRAALATAPPAPSPRIANRESIELLQRVREQIADPTRPLLYTGPQAPIASLTYGYAGIAYAALRMASSTDDARLLALADAWSERAAASTSSDAFYNDAVQITPEVVGHVSPFHTASGVSAVQALIANARTDRWTAEAAVNAFLHETSQPCSNPDITLGHASILLAIMLLLESGSTAGAELLRERGDKLNALILQSLRTPEDIEYLGIAHGHAGLLYAALRWARAGKNEPIPLIRERLGDLARHVTFTRRGARWPIQAKPGALSLPGWCNGSAGYAHLWTLAHQIYQDPRYLVLAEKAAIDAFEGAGGGHGLCCGFAGQAYAQLALYKHTGEAVWLDQARALAEKAATTANQLNRQNAPGLPFSLYKGDIGVAVLISDLDRPELAAMPFFEAAWPIE